MARSTQGAAAPRRHSQTGQNQQDGMHIPTAHQRALKPPVPAPSPHDAANPRAAFSQAVEQHRRNILASSDHPMQAHCAFTQPCSLLPALWCLSRFAARQTQDGCTPRPMPAMCFAAPHSVRSPPWKNAPKPQNYTKESNAIVDRSQFTLQQSAPGKCLGVHKSPEVENCCSNSKQTLSQTFSTH